MSHRHTHGTRGNARALWLDRPGPSLKLALAMLMALAFTATASAQEASTGRIAGTVTDSANGQPLGSVSVSVSGTRIGALTDAAGKYAINSVPAGTHSIETRRIG